MIECHFLTDFVHSEFKRREKVRSKEAQKAAKAAAAPPKEAKAAKNEEDVEDELNPNVSIA